MFTLDEVAEKMIESQKECRKNSDPSPRDNLLFRYLYDAYGDLTGTGRRFDDVLAGVQNGGRYSSSYAEELSAWYVERYDSGDDEDGEKKTQGISRAVTRKTVFGDRDYKFDKPLKADRFTYYLAYGKPLSNGDAYDFILHTAVAFLLSPEQLEEVLVAYGFHSLHVRNIHHMAIYCVLRDAKHWSVEDRRTRNPFQDVKTLYDDARKLVTVKQPVEPQVLAGGREDTFLTDSTRVIHDYIWEQESLTKDSLLVFIKNHSEIYDMRHHRLLSEHKRLASLFTVLYTSKNRDQKRDEREEEYYSLYRFVNDYCEPLNHKRKHKKKNVDDQESSAQKRFIDQIYGYVANGSQHPTRELMIILWLYSYCFLYCPKVKVAASFREKSPRRSAGDTFIKQPEQPFLEFVDTKQSKEKKKTYEFRILEYLSDDRDFFSPLSGFSSRGPVPAEFSGAALIAFLNEKLNSYSWRQLDSKNAFDSVILCLRSIKIVDPGGDSGPDASYVDTASNTNTLSIRKERICFYRTDTVANVPVPLVLISKLLRRISSRLDERKPLICDFYELI